MNTSHQRWLLEQLPQWEREGLLNAEAARTLRERNAVDDSQPGLAQIVMGALGALLIGTGLITVIGYNWDDFSRPVRLLFAFLPLLITQVFSFRELQRGAASTAWVRETAALLQALATGACIAIVSQIYNLGGDWPDFLFWWLLLSLPLVWVLRSQAVAIFYLIGIAVWSVNQAEYRDAWYHSALFYPVLLLGLAPFWPGWPPRWQLGRSLQWVGTLSFCVGLAAAAGSSVSLRMHTSYVAFGSVLWLWTLTASALLLLPFRAAACSDKRRQDPHVTVCGFFLLAVSFAASFSDFSSGTLSKLEMALTMPWAWGCLTLVGLFALPAIRQQRWALLGVSSLSLSPLLALLAGSRAEPILPWLMTLHLLGIGILLIVLELAGRRGAPRLGATLICVLILARMFESELSLLIKGLVFIAVGVAFLAFNILMSRQLKKKQAATV